MQKRKGKIVSLLLTAVIAVVLSGTGHIKKVQAAKDTAAALTATVEKNFTVSAGDTMVIPVKVSCAEDMRGLKGDLKGQYDETVLSFEKAEYTGGIPSGMESVSGGNFGFATGSRFKSGTVQLTFKVLK